MTYHKHCILKFREVIFEPSHGVEVKVVGRLVEQQVVGVAEQSLCQKHAHLLVTGKVAHKHIVAVLLDAQTAQQSRGVALGVPPFQLGEFLLQLRGADAVGVGEIGLGIQLVFLFHYIPEHGVALEHGVEHGAVVEFEVILLKHAHTLARAHRHCAVGRRQLVRKNPHQRGLAGTVGTDYAVAVARREFQVYVLKQNSFTELNT